jgi:hypothetical protein
MVLGSFIFVSILEGETESKEAEAEVTRTDSFQISFMCTNIHLKEALIEFRSMLTVYLPRP